MKHAPQHSSAEGSIHRPQQQATPEVAPVLPSSTGCLCRQRARVLRFACILALASSLLQLAASSCLLAAQDVAPSQTRTQPASSLPQADRPSEAGLALAALAFHLAVLSIYLAALAGMVLLLLSGSRNSLPTRPMGVIGDSRDEDAAPTPRPAVPHPSSAGTLPAGGHFAPGNPRRLPSHPWPGRGPASPAGDAGRRGQLREHAAAGAKFRGRPKAKKRADGQRNFPRPARPRHTSPGSHHHGQRRLHLSHSYTDHWIHGVAYRRYLCLWKDGSLASLRYVRL